MGMRRVLLLVALCAALAFGGAALLARERMARCAYVPLVAGDLLAAPDFTHVETNPRSGPGVPPLPAGGSAPARGVQVGSFTVSGSGRSFQLIGIANAVQTPPVAVRAGQSYCVALQAIADSPVSATRLRAIFEWRDQQGATIATDVSDWQMVRRWEGPDDRGGWSQLAAGFRAPAEASLLAISLHPASDDRVYLDDIHVRPSVSRLGIRDWRLDTSQSPIPNPQSLVSIEPWPEGRRGALSFSFDWETAMGGLIHSLSDDVASANPAERGLRMREGITTTLGLFRPYGIRATYYANGYNFLLGNPDRRQFMGDPTFSWATPATSERKGWSTDRWTTTPWFADDPYGTVQSDPGWYFGDLIAVLQREKQDIQTHTFSHMYGAYASADDWRADLQAWREVASERGVAMARSLAFPWSSSAGMSYANWDVLEQAGITSVTRTNINLPQFQLADRASLRCRSVPGHERILACPDFYMHDRASAAQAMLLIERAIAAGGMIDLWAHTEEVVSPEQIALWGQVVGYAAQQRDAGKLWIAPLAEIADWQAAVAELKIENVEWRNQGDSAAPTLSFTIQNVSERNLSAVTLKLPFQPKKISVDGVILNSQFSILNSMQLDIQARQTLEVQAWPA
jgi:hypothetical protein